MPTSTPPSIADRVSVRIEVPRGGRVKRELHGEHPRVEYVSPWPSPFNYGFLVDTIGPDGDPLDAIIVGEALEIGSIVTCNVLAIVRFVDGGSPDDKWICGTAPLTRADLAEIDQFFKRYAKLKRPLHWIRGRRSETAYLGIDQA